MTPLLYTAGHALSTVFCRRSITAPSQRGTLFPQHHPADHSSHQSRTHAIIIGRKPAMAEDNNLHFPTLFRRDKATGRPTGLIQVTRE